MTKCKDPELEVLLNKFRDIPDHKVKKMMIKNKLQDILMETEPKLSKPDIKAWRGVLVETDHNTVELEIGECTLTFDKKSNIYVHILKNGKEVIHNILTQNDIEDKDSYIYPYYGCYIYAESKEVLCKALLMQLDEQIEAFEQEKVSLQEQLDEIQHDLQQNIGIRNKLLGIS